MENLKMQQAQAVSVMARITAMRIRKANIQLLILKGK